jgi:hypothetical protein
MTAAGNEQVLWQTMLPGPVHQIARATLGRPAGPGGGGHHRGRRARPAHRPGAAPDRGTGHVRLHGHRHLRERHPRGGGARHDPDRVLAGVRRRLVRTSPTRWHLAGCSRPSTATRPPARPRPRWRRSRSIQGTGSPRRGASLAPLSEGAGERQRDNNETTAVFCRFPDTAHSRGR